MIIIWLQENGIAFFFHLNIEFLFKVHIQTDTNFPSLSYNNVTVNAVCRWFCHMDDDVYLNVPKLVEMLKKYNYKEDWYLGKPSLKHPLEVVDRDNPGVCSFRSTFSGLFKLLLLISLATLYLVDSLFYFYLKYLAYSSYFYMSHLLMFFFVSVHFQMKLTFWFATGGAGFCISRSLALKMAPYAGYVFYTAVPCQLTTRYKIF